MAYKYKRGQLFGKRLDVPKEILDKVYNRTLSFAEFINYDLQDKIPTSCVRDEDYKVVYDFENRRLTFKDAIELGCAEKFPSTYLSFEEKRIIEKFGIEKAKTLDWELINSNPQTIDSYKNVVDILMSFESNTDNLASQFYEKIITILPPSEYSTKLKKLYPDRYFEINYDEDENIISEMKYLYNKGELSLTMIIANWEMFQNKNLDFCLVRDNIKTEQIREFMSSDYSKLIHIFRKYEKIPNVINKLCDKELTLEEKQLYIKEICHKAIQEVRNNQEENRMFFTREEWREIFKYVSLEEEILKTNSYRGVKLLEELKHLPEDYIYNIPFSFTSLFNYDAVGFMGEFGIENVVDFDNECGHFFSRENDKMLKLMNDIYLRYANNRPNNQNPYMTSTSDMYDENNLYLGRLFNKDEFYESMRRMIVYGPTAAEYYEMAPNYKEMVGEFRIRNQALFISTEAPQELQDAFYTKSITPELLKKTMQNGSSVIDFLKDKNFESCFKNREIKVMEKDAGTYYENLYTFISKKTDYETFINYIIEYSGVLSVVFDSSLPFSYGDDLKISEEETFKNIKNKITESFIKILLKEQKSYPTYIPQEIKDNFPTFFLGDNAPQELQDAFYNRTLTPEFILTNKEYIKCLKEVRLDLIYKNMPVAVQGAPRINLVTAIEKTFGKDDAFDVMLLYGKYIEKTWDLTDFINFKYNVNFSKDDLLDEIDEYMIQTIINNGMKYDRDMPSHFKNNNPTFFLNENIEKEIGDKFYNREFTIKDFSLNPELIDMFDNANIVCGFHESLSWMIPLFKDYEDSRLANLNRLKVITEYEKIEDVQLKSAFREYILEFGDNIDMDKIEYVTEILERLSLSNSNEIFTFRRQLATQILKADNPIDVLDKVENIFIKSNIPTVGKIYSCFEILHPDFRGFNFNSSMLSPVLKKASTNGKKAIVFSDLIKVSFGSNNRAIKEYLQNIEIGTSLYEKIISGQIQYEMLNDSEIKELNKFSKHLATLYDNTIKGKREESSFASTGNAVEDILKLTKKISPDGSLDYNLADRVVRMFCGFAGINTLEEAKTYIIEKTKIADNRNREAAMHDMILEKGDFVKGIGGIGYLGTILQNGSVSKEFLGASADSDATPLDTDVSMVMSDDGTIGQKIGSTAARDYGPIWFVLKNDDRFVTTRDKESTYETQGISSNLEVFLTGHLGDDHYGIRTGFASTEINYIVMENFDYRVGIEIAKNGFYIPVANKEGKIVFTPDDYKKLRGKMAGLSYYDENSYVCSHNLITDDTMILAEEMERNYYETQAKRNKINEIIKEAMDELGLQLKTTIDGDLTPGFVELIDTGSTGRGTNKPGDGDFDFMMRLDKDIISDPSKLKQLKETILNKLGKAGQKGITDSGDFRIKEIPIDNDTVVDIDITFAEKTDQITYSTDMALQDRLTTISKSNPEEYKYVLANILLAKQVLKEAGAYKPDRGDNPQGGLGGVGIENWILQNGGSFVDAARSFIDAAEGKSFSEFQSIYQIWDFGENHLSARRYEYPHDNFVANNMSEEGYKKTVAALSTYIEKYDYQNSGAKNM